MTDLTNLANDIQAVKSDLANAISLKGVPCTTNDAFNSYSDKVNSIQSGYFAGVNLANISYMPASAGISFYNLGTYTNGAVMFNSLTSFDGAVISFENCSGINGTVEFSNLTSLGAYSQIVFRDCNHITGANFPKLAQFPQYTIVFNDCQNLTFASFPNVIQGNMAYMFGRCSNLTTIDFSNYKMGLTNGAFLGCSSLEFANFPSLLSTNNASSMFQNCYNLKQVDFSAVTNSGGSTGSFQSTFANCRSLTNFSLPNYTQGFIQTFGSCFLNCNNLSNVNIRTTATTPLGQSAFTNFCNNCTNLTNFYLNIPEPTNPSQYCFANSFRNCVNFGDASFIDNINALNMGYIFDNCFCNCYGFNDSHIYFNSLISATNSTSLNNMIYGVNNCTVHFPSAMQSVIGSWASVTGGFGGIGTTVLFDL